MTETQIPQAYIDSIDRNYWTPSERASGVHALLEAMREQLKKDPSIPEAQIPSDWDLLCYAVEYIGLQAVAIGSEELKERAVDVSRWLYGAHYSNPFELYGKPDKPKELSEEDEG